MAEELVDDVDKAILILNIQSIESLSVTSAPITTAATRTRTRLVVIIFCDFFDNASGTGCWDAVQRLLTHAYVQATTVSQKHDKILMSVDVVLRGIQGPASAEPVDKWNAIFYSGELGGLPISQEWLSLPAIQLSDASKPSTVTSNPFTDGTHASTTYPVVALGGTFDHLHAGHKILLSMAAWIAQEKIIVGVTDDALLVKKVHKELLEPFSTRTDAVRDFLRLFKPGLVYDGVPLTDVYGPTGWDPNIQALVVSKETLPGANSIASLRAKKSFPPLETFVIDVISAVSADLGTNDPEALKNAKMSSTFIREWVHKQQTLVTDSNTDTQLGHA